MTGVSENGILGQREFHEFKSRSIRLKFLQALFQGVGGAMVFSLITAIAINGAMLALPLMIGLPVVGVICIALGTKFMFENQVLDQDFQAKKIGAATNGGQRQAAIVNAIQETPEPVRTTPPGMAAIIEDKAEAASADSRPRTRIREAAAVQRLEAGDLALEQAAARH